MEETYTNSSKVRYVLLGVGLLCLALAILTGFKWYDAEFDYLFGTIRYCLGFGFLAFILILGSSYMGGENRKGHIYLNSNGELDMATPRRYEKLDKPVLARFFGRTNSFMGTTIKSFDYADGCVTVENTKGDVISGPLSNLTFKFNTDKNKGIYFYQLTDSEGNRIKFHKNNATLEDKEWDDIAMILDNCGTVKEGKLSKIANKATKVVEAVQNFDASEIVGSTVDAAQNASALFAKRDGYIARTMYKKYKDEIENPDADKSFSKSEKGILWVVGGIVGIYILIVLILNLINFPAWHSDKTDTDDYNIEAAAIEEAIDADDEYVTDETDYSVESSSMGSASTLTGTIAGSDVIMEIVVDGRNVYGRYRYKKITPPSWLEFEGETYSGYVEFEERNDAGEVTGTYQCDLMMDSNGDLQSLTGTMTNYKGKTYKVNLHAQ